MLVPLYEAVHTRLDTGTGTRLLGLGCGSGLALLMAAARGAEVTGVERDPYRLALARERLAPGAVPGSAVPGTGVPGGVPPGTAVPGGPAFPAGATSAPPASPGLPTAPPTPASPAAPESPAPSPGRAHRPSLPPPSAQGRRGRSPRVLGALPERPAGPPFTLVTLFEGVCSLSAPERLLSRAARLAEHGSAVVVAGWGPPERCRTEQVLRLAARLAEPAGGWAAGDPFRLSGPGDLEEIAVRAGLRPDGSGRVACPFAYPDMESAVRGLCSTGLFDAAVRATGRGLVEKELSEALHGFRLSDGSVRMDNVFRYTVARVV